MGSRKFSQVNKKQNNYKILCENSISGESYKSHKKWKMLKGFKGAAYLTVLTREFLLEDVLTGEGGRRIDNNPVDSKTYNVSFYNKKLGALHQKEKIIITRNPKYGEHKVYCQ